MRTGLRVYLPDRGTALFGGDPVLGLVAVRSDRDVELRAVSCRDEVLGEMMIPCPGGKVDKLLRDRGDLGLTRDIRDANDGVGVRDVEGVSDERHSEGRV